MRFKFLMNVLMKIQLNSRGMRKKYVESNHQKCYISKMLYLKSMFYLQNIKFGQSWYLSIQVW